MFSLSLFFSHGGPRVYIVVVSIKCIFIFYVCVGESSSAVTTGVKILDVLFLTDIA